ncbi:MAG: phytanoyl-CoA dioxygenase family protein [Chitinophagales bacterium]|nr:phytanoyl-CoA dioxygenase family protein [Chitinophagales bacterium]
MRQVFKDSHINDSLVENGYVVVPFDKGDELGAYKDRIYSLSPSDGFGAFQKSLMHEQDYHCTFFDTNMGYRDAVFNIITDLFASTVSNLLVDYKFIQGNVFIKLPKMGYVAPHQNLTVVDESKFTSLSFWCPAQDTTAENGTMVLVPKSQKKFMRYRTTNITWPLLPLFQDYTNPFLKTIDVKKGELLIIDDSIVHGTLMNNSNKERFVFHAMLAPSEANVIYCDVKKADKKVIVYEVPDLFWQHYLPGDQPIGLKEKETLPYKEHDLTLEQFEKELRGSKSFLKDLLAIFK